MSLKILSGLFLGFCKVWKVDTWQGHWLGTVGVHHGVTFGSGKVCSPAIFETCFSYDKDIYMLQLIIINYVLLHNCPISIDIYSPINKFYSFINFSLLINAVILLLDCIILIHFLYLNIIWSFI